MDGGDSLRIVHVLRAPMGGVFRHVHDLALAHQRAGHRVGVVCDVAGTPGYNEAMVAELAGQLALGLHRTPMRRAVGPGDLADALGVFRIIKKLQPDVLHGHGAKGGVFARALGSLLRVERSRVARFYSPHGGSLHYDATSRSGRLYFHIERMLERLTDHILFVAEFERNAYAEKIGEPTCRWTVNHNGLRDDEFEAVAPSDDAADFLFLGELRILKGPDLLLQALSTLRDEGHASVRAILVGDGPDAAAIRSLAGELSLRDAITFRPPMPARQAFALARCFVMPSRAEALPYVILEALAAGMPLIATRVGGIPEIMGEDNAALVAPQVDDLAGMMRLALTEPEALRNRMPDRELLHSRFSVKVMAGNAMQAYRQALSRSRQGAAPQKSRSSSVS